MCVKAAATIAHAEPGKFPAEFRYWEKLDDPAVQRARRLCQRLFRFDP